MIRGERKDPQSRVGGKRNHRQQREHPRRGYVARQSRTADRACRGVPENPVSQLLCHRSGPAAHHLGAIGTGMAAPADQDFGTKCSFQVLPSAVKQCPCVQRGHAEHKPEIDVMAAGEV
jgi:hypothetical protein